MDAGNDIAAASMDSIFGNLYSSESAELLVREADNLWFNVWLWYSLLYPALLELSQEQI